MSVYDCKTDNRGRILLPIQIRKRFEGGARITSRPDSDIMSLEPLVKGRVTAEVDIFCEPQEIVTQAWHYKVAFVPVGEENGNAVIRVTGSYNDVRSFCGSLGYPEEDFDEYLVEGE